MTSTAAPTPPQDDPATNSDHILLPAALGAFACLVAYLATLAAGPLGAQLGGVFIAGAAGLGVALFLEARTLEPGRLPGAAAVVIVLGTWGLLCVRLTQAHVAMSGWGCEIAPGLDLLFLPTRLAGGLGYFVLLTLAPTIVGLLVRRRRARRVALALAYAAIGPLCLGIQTS